MKATIELPTEVMDEVRRRAEYPGREAVFAAAPGAPGADLTDDELLALDLERAASQ